MMRKAKRDAASVDSYEAISAMAAPKLVDLLPSKPPQLRRPYATQGIAHTNIINNTWERITKAFRPPDKWLDIGVESEVVLIIVSEGINSFPESQDCFMI